MQQRCWRGLAMQRSERQPLLIYLRLSAPAAVALCAMLLGSINEAGKLQPDLRFNEFDCSAVQGALHRSCAQDQTGMARPSGVTAGEQQRQQQQHSDAEPAHAQLLRGLHFADPHGSWGDNALSLLSAQASLSADPASPRKHGSPAAATPRTGDNEAGCRVALDEAAQPQQPAQPCHSDGLTANTGSESPDGGTSAAPVNSGTGFAPPGGDPDGSSPPPVQQPGKKATKKCAPLPHAGCCICTASWAWQLHAICILSKSSSQRLLLFVISTTGAVHDWLWVAVCVTAACH